MTLTFHAIYKQPLQTLVNADLYSAVRCLSQQRRSDPERGNKKTPLSPTSAVVLLSVTPQQPPNSKGQSPGQACSCRGSDAAEKHSSYQAPTITTPAAQEAPGNRPHAPSSAGSRHPRNSSLPTSGKPGISKAAKQHGCPSTLLGSGAGWAPGGEVGGLVRRAEAEGVGGVGPSRCLPRVESAAALLTADTEEGVEHAAVPDLAEPGIGALALHLQARLGEVHGEGACGESGRQRPAGPAPPLLPSFPPAASPNSATMEASPPYTKGFQFSADMAWRNGAGAGPGRTPASPPRNYPEPET